MNLDNRILLFFNNSNDWFLDGLSKYLTYGGTWIPLYVLLGFLIIKNNKTMSQVMLIFACGFLGVALSGVLSDLVIKPMTMRTRPCYDMEINSMLHLVEGVKVSGYSFFSSHAANTFSLTMFFTLLVRSNLLSLSLFVWATVNAWTRLYLGVHYPSDVLIGMLWGLLTGAFVYFIYYKINKKFSSRQKYISTHYTSTGYAVSDIDVCVAVIIFTFIYAILRSTLQ